MKNFSCALLIAILSLLLSCVSHQQPTQQPSSPGETITQPSKDHLRVDTVLASIQSKNDPTQSFAIYLPPAYNDSSNLPLIIFFDPHGGGAFAISKYRNLARLFNTILVGSNTSRNGVSNDVNDAVANNLIAEIPLRFSVNKKRITLAGFSGGAKVAMDNASHNPAVSALIYGGAFSDNPPANIPMLGFAGVNDMNYSDLISFDQSLKSSNNNLLIEWNGKHEWPDSAVFKDAFYWNAFNAMRNHSASTNKSLIAQFLNENKKVLEAQNDPLKAAAICKKVIYFLTGLEDVSDYARKFATLQQDPSYLKAMTEKNQSLNQEQMMKQQYVKDFNDKDLNWWKQELARMRAVNDPDQKPMYQRLLSFISLAGNSLSMRAMKANQPDAAAKTLAVYQLADPKNPEVQILYADYYASKGDNENAIHALQQSVKLGWTDSTRVMTESFLIPLHNDEAFKSVVKQMK